MFKTAEELIDKLECFNFDESQTELLFKQPGRNKACIMPLYYDSRFSFIISNSNLKKSDYYSLSFFLNSLKALKTLKPQSPLFIADKGKLFVINSLSIYMDGQNKYKIIINLGYFDYDRYDIDTISASKEDK